MSTLKSKIESLLFIGGKPLTIKQIADLTKKKREEIKKAGDELVEEYKDSKQGVQIIKNSSKYQMVSSPENAKLIQEFIKDETTGELSRPSLEALTIIAYRGPVSKIDLDRIRGVNCALIIRNLLLRGLIEAKHDKQKNETYYTVTFDFIRFLGISDVHQLPEYERLSKDDSITRFLSGEKEPTEDKPEIRTTAHSEDKNSEDINKEESDSKEKLEINQ
jgi:segregation and condensation protein B